MWIKPNGNEVAFPVYDCKGLDETETVPELYSATLDREFGAGDYLLFAGVNTCVEDIVGLSRVRLKDLKLDHLAFFELALSETFPSNTLTVDAFENQYRCRIRFINREGNTLHRERGNLMALDVLFVESDYEILHLHFSNDFENVKEVPAAVLELQNSMPSLLRRLQPFVALVSLLFVVIVNAAGLFRLYVSATMGIIAVLVAGILTWREVIAAVPGNLLVMIAFSFSLSAALTNSGVGSLLGEYLPD